MSFTAHQLRHPIALQRRTDVVDENGDIVTAWTTYAEPFARVDPMIGREFYAAAAVQAEDTIKFTLRWRADVVASDRLLYNGGAFNITSVMNVAGRNRELLIYARSL